MVEGLIKEEEKEEKKTLIEADTGVLTREGSLYDLGNLKMVNMKPENIG